MSSTAAIAVSGADSSTGIGVLGTSSSGYGVKGISSTSHGVYGTATSTSGDGVHGVVSSTWSGVAGINNSSGAGVYGSCASGACAGTYGTCSTANCSAVEGHLTGTPGSNAAAIWGSDTSTGGTHYAGWFDGNGNITGNLTIGGTCTGCSDIRMKQNVKPLRGAIDQLLQLKGVTYEWTDPSLHGNETGRVSGFIAQDVEKVFPGWVKDEGYTAPDGQKYKTLDLRQVEALEVESIRELKARIDAQDTIIKELLDARRPTISFNPSSLFVGFGLVTVAGAVVVTRRKRDEKRS